MYIIYLELGSLSLLGACMIYVRSRGLCGELSFDLDGALLPELAIDSSAAGPFLLPQPGCEPF